MGASRTCVVTGAGSGIGLAVARRWVMRGDRVIGMGRTRKKLLAAAAELGGAFLPLTLDVGDGAAVQAAFSTLTAVDVLVVSAGICAPCPIERADADGIWRRSIAVNLGGAYHSIRAASRLMPDGGAMVLISSGLGKRGRAGYAAYAASKHGMLGLMRCVARELAPRKITVNAVCPGWVATDMSAADIVAAAARENTSAEECRARAVASVPLGRFVDPDEVASLIDWLASPQACAITGQAYNICGGELDF